MSSFKKINYSLRPAKAVERKMLNFALKKLSHIDKLSNYQYVGFGSTTFHDFVLFHRELGIDEMTSIEISGNEQRFHFNKPFYSIDMMFGSSEINLPNINWKKKTLLWLDYDKTLQAFYLSDIDTFLSSAVSGSAFLVTINCEADVYGTTNEERRDKIITEIGEHNLPFGNKQIDFAHNNLAKTLYRIIVNRINSTLLSRNGPLENTESVIFEQLFHFHYADGVKMLTLGGLILNESDHKIFNNCCFDELHFVRKGEDEFKIDIPILTLKEIRFLNAQLPTGIDAVGNLLDSKLTGGSNPNLSLTEIVKFKEIYKFFPHYAEAFSI